MSASRGITEVTELMSSPMCVPARMRSSTTTTGTPVGAGITILTTAQAEIIHQIGLSPPIRPIPRTTQAGAYTTAEAAVIDKGSTGSKQKSPIAGDFCFVDDYPILNSGVIAHVKSLSAYWFDDGVV